MNLFGRVVERDGGSEASEREHSIGFVAELPRDGARPPPATETDAESVERVMRDYDVVHASAELEPEFIAHFVARKQRRHEPSRVDLSARQRCYVTVSTVLVHPRTNTSLSHCWYNYLSK